MSLGPRAAARRPVRSERLQLGDSDPAIPLDRVPYFLRDLRNLGIAAAAMLVLLVAGAQLIPLVVK